MNTEEAIIRRALAGDRDAFAQLVRAYQRPVYNLCYRMLGDAHEAEDAAQETFLRAYANLKGYDAGRKFSSWLLSIGTHYCIDRLRRRRFTYSDIDQIGPALISPYEGERPEHRYLREEEAQVVQELLARLPPAYRGMLILRYWHEASYEEIGQILGLSEPAVKSRLHRARKALAELMTGRSATHPCPAPAEVRG